MVFVPAVRSLSSAPLMKMPSVVERQPISVAEQVGNGPEVIAFQMVMPLTTTEVVSSARTYRDALVGAEARLNVSVKIVAKPLGSTTGPDPELATEIQSPPGSVDHAPLGLLPMSTMLAGPVPP